LEISGDNYPDSSQREFYTKIGLDHFLNNEIYNIVYKLKEILSFF